MISHTPAPKIPPTWTVRQEFLRDMSLGSPPNLTDSRRDGSEGPKTRTPLLPIMLSFFLQSSRNAKPAVLLIRACIRLRLSRTRRCGLFSEHYPIRHFTWWVEWLPSMCVSQLGHTCSSIPVCVEACDFPLFPASVCISRFSLSVRAIGFAYPYSTTEVDRKWYALGGSVAQSRAARHS